MTEEQKYQVEQKFPNFEIRRYEPCVLADVIVNSSFESAGTQGFGSLIGYISGGNQPGKKIAMTAPVIQEPVSKFAMTSPVLQENSGTENIVSFVMPSGMTLESMPIPNSSKVSLRNAPEQLVAASRFSGRWTLSSYQRQLLSLESNLQSHGYSQIGPARFARFDPPWTPWFMRRNEIQIPIATPTQ